MDWSVLSPVPSLDGARVEVRVFHAYDVKDELKDLGYTFESNGGFWRRLMLAEGFSFEALLSQQWKRGAVRVEVLAEQGERIHAS